MNDLYGIEPGAYLTPKEWGAQLASFGPHTGRYVLVLPDYKIWSEAVLSRSSVGDLERERIRTILRRALIHSPFRERSFDRWSITERWLENAIRYWRTANSKHKFIYVHEECFGNFSENRPDDCKILFSADNFLPSSPADEEIETQPEDYWKVSQWLCRLSAEIHLIDPYFNPVAGADVRKVFVHYVEQIARLKKPIDVHFWVRCRERDAGSGLQKASQEVERLIKEAARGGRSGLRFHYHWVSDDTSRDKLHARYLLTEKGGIQFDQGFQVLRPSGKRNMVSPVGLDLHRELFDRFTSGKNAFDVEKTVKVVV